MHLSGAETIVFTSVKVINCILETDTVREGPAGGGGHVTMTLTFGPQNL